MPFAEDTPAMAGPFDANASWPPVVTGQPVALRHTLTPPLVGLIAIGGVIGAGLFVGSAASIRSAGPLVLPGYLLAGLLVVLEMRMLAEMAMTNPAAGSFIAHIRIGLGPRAGFVAGWSYFLFWVTTAGSEVIAAGPLWSQLTGAPAWTGGLLAMVGTLGVNLASALAYARSEAVLSLVKVAVIVGFVLVGAASAFIGLPTGFHWHRIVADGVAPQGWLAGLAVLPILLQTLTGFELATVAAVESADPARSVAYAARSLVLRIALFYLASIIIVLGIVPLDRITIGVSPFATALRQLGIGSGAMFMTAVVLLAVVSCLNSALYAASRVLRELTLSRDAPRACGRLSRAGVPVMAIICTVALELVTVACAILSPRRAYVIVLALSGLLIIVNYVLAGLAHISLRSRAGCAPVHMAMWGFPALSWACVVTFIAILVAMAIIPATRLDFYVGTGMVICLTLIAVFHSRRGIDDPFAARNTSI